MPSSIVLAAIYGDSILAAAALGSAYTAVSFAINIVASSIVARAFSPNSNLNSTGSAYENPGNRVQTPPAGSNKLSVIYGTAYTGGTITDLSITNDNQTLYYVLALSEVTNSNSGQTPDVFTFGNVYWGGKKVIFDGTNQYKVTALLDESTGVYDYTVAGKLEFYFYSNGSNSPTNSTISAITLLQDPNLTYKWDNTKLMTNCAFVVLKLNYSQTANLTGIQQTKFQVTNPRTLPGDCFLDYLTSTRYGAAIPVANVDTASLTALNTYCSQTVTYTPYTGGSATLQRFLFSGTLDTTQPVMTNLQQMATCCDCLLKYGEITGTWGVIVQQNTSPIAMALDDSVLVGPIQVTPIDLASSFNVAEIKFPDGTTQDSFNTVTFDLATIAPSLLYPNEPVNKQSISLPLVNDSVRAQLIANRALKAAREDLQIMCNMTYQGIQLEAGDLVTLTNANYGWTAKIFRLSRVVENFNDDGSVTTSLTMMAYDAAVYSDASVTQFTPSPNTGLGSPTGWGSITAPTISNIQASAINPSFDVVVTIAPQGITQYAEIWYSAYASPTTSQLMFAGTTAIQSSGSPYAPSASTTSTLINIAAGDWYFFSRMVNNLGSSDYSPASSVFHWRPQTFQFTNRYLVVAYADDLVGTNITATRSGKNYYGLYNSTTTSYSSNPADYTWYLAQPTFGTSYYLTYTNRTGRKFSFVTSTAAQAAGTAAFVPTITSLYDPSIWSSLADGLNYIDLDARTGQLTQTGTTSVGTGQIAISNNPNGQLVGSLAQFLDFGGSSTYTASLSQITIDIYGRVVGIIAPDGFYFSSQNITATAAQTVFTPTARGTGYISGQDLVFKNGCLLDLADYSETTTTVTLGVAAASGDIITIASMRSTSAANYYEPLAISYASGTGTTTITYTGLPYQTIIAGDKLTFGNTGSPTQYTVSSVNYATKQITFTGSVTTSGTPSIYRYRAATTVYPSFSRYTTTLSSASSYTPTTWTVNSGYELIFLNGTVVPDPDYDIISGTITNFPGPSTGLMTIIQFGETNLTTPVGNPIAVSTNTVNGQAIYSFSYVPAYFELYNNGVIQIQGTDYTTGSGSYTLSPTPTSNLNLLVQQTFSAQGAA